MTKLEKMAKEALFTRCNQFREMDIDSIPWLRYANQDWSERAFIDGYEHGFKAARQMAATKIKASVNLKGIDHPSEALINCSLQAKHDHDLVLKLGEEEE